MNTLKVGAVVYDPRVTIIWEMIEQYYKENGSEIKATFFKDYKLQIDALEKGDIDVAWNSPLAHLDAHLRFSGREKFGCMRDTDQDLKTYLVVRKDRDFHSVDDLKEKVIGFGAIDSPQARLIPIYHLHKKGLEFSEDYKEKRFDIGVGLHGDHIGGEKDSMLAMLHGDVDATFCLCSNFDAWVKDGTVDPNVVKVLDRTDVFDHCIFTFRPEISEEELTKFTDIMLKMDYQDSKQKEIMDLEGLKEWKKGRLSGYEQITKANEYLNQFIQGFNCGKYTL